MKQSVALLLLLIWMVAGPAMAQSSPRWKSLKPEQQNFLLEAFNLPEGQRGLFTGSVPDEVKQALLDSIWNLLTPEKRVQVLLYAHLESPFSATSDSAARVTAPEWAKFSPFQRSKAFEAMRLDPTQRMIFEAMTPELRQMAFATLWSYLDPEARRTVLGP